MKPKHIFEVGDNLTKLAFDLDTNSPSAALFKIEDHFRQKHLGGNSSKFQVAVKFNKNSSDSKNLDFSEGVLEIRNRSSEIPLKLEANFIVENGKLIYPKKIHFLGQQTIYSDRAVKRILEFFLKAEENPQVLTENSPYAGVSEANPNSLDAGGIRELVRIRDSESGNNSIAAYASEVFAAMEKISALQPLSKAHLAELEAEAGRLAFEVENREMERLAAEANTVVDAALQSGELFKTLKELPWKGAFEFEADKMHAVQIIDANGSDGLAMKGARLFPTVLGLNGSKRNEVFIIDKDQNYKLLRGNVSEDKAYRVINADLEPMTLTGEPLLQIALENPREAKEVRGFILDGNSVIGPVLISGIPGCSDVAALKVRMAHKHEETLLILDKDFGSTVMKTPTQDEVLSYLENKAKNPDSEIFFHLYNPVIFAGADKRFIAVKDHITTPCTSLRDIVFGGDDRALNKIASSGSIVIKKPIPDRALYMLTLRESFMKTKSFSDIPAETVVTLAMAAGVSGTEVSTMIGYLDAGEKQIERPAAIDLSKLDGSAINMRQESLMNRFKDKLFSSTTAKDVVEGAVKGGIVEGIGDAIAESPELFFSLTDPVNTAAGLVQSLTRVANDSAALADRFEKIAIDSRSEDMQTIAALMATTHRMDKLLMKIASEDRLYYANELFDQLGTLKPAIEKAASMLDELDFEMRVSGHQAIGHNTLCQAMQTLDRLAGYIAR